MYRFAAFLAALSLVPSSALGGAPQAPPSPDWDAVSLEVRSWGALVNSWTIRSSGGGSWAEAVRDEGTAPNAPAPVAWHEIPPETANYITLEKILRRLPVPAPDSQDCANFMSDAAYGTLRLTKGATTTEIAWNDGCMDDDYRAFISILREADQQVATLGKAGPVSRTEDPPVR